MTNRVRGEISVPMGDVIYTLALTYEAMTSIESDTGQGVLELFNKSYNGTLSLSEIAVILHHSMIVGEGEVRPPLVEIGEKLLDVGINSVITPIGLFFTQALSGDAKKQKAAKKTPPKK